MQHFSPLSTLFSLKFVLHLLKVEQLILKNMWHKMLKTFLAVFFITSSTLAEQKKSNFYDFSAQTSKGKEFKFDQLKGKVVLIVNVASLCGYTDSDYKLMSKLYERFGGTDKFEILAFPCNQFGAQEPWEDEEVEKFVRSKYNAKYPIMSKIDVIGGQAHPLWKYLNSLSDEEPRWNFHKYLIDGNGHLAATFPTGSSHQEIEQNILKLVQKALGKEL